MKWLNNLKSIDVDRVLVLIVVSIILFYSLYDTLTFRVTGMQKLLAAIISFVIVYLSCVCLFSSSKKESVYKLCLLLVIICLIGMLSATFDNLNTRWFLADIGGWLLLTSFVILLSTIHNRDCLASTLFLMVGLLWFIAVIGYVWGERVNGRFEPPVLFVVVGLPLILVYAKKIPVVVAGLFAHIITGYLCLASGNRTVVLIWLFISFFSLMYWVVRNSCTSSGWIKNILLVFLTVISLLGVSYFNEKTISLVGSTRIYKLFTSSSYIDAGTDQSLLSRADEVQDSWNYMKETNSSWRYLFGFGHGASFPTNLADKNPQNMDEFGKMHNIHFGPMLIFFRYGLIGIFLYTILLVKILFSGLKLLVNPIREDNYNKLVITGITASYVFSWLMRNEFANPLFLFVIALFLTQSNLSGATYFQYGKKEKRT